MLTPLPLPFPLGLGVTGLAPHWRFWFPRPLSERGIRLECSLEHIDLSSDLPGVEGVTRHSACTPHVRD